MIGSIIAGLLIGMSDFVYINASNKFVAAFLFPVALLTIIKEKLPLYTGRIGKIYTDYSLPYLGLVLVGNIIGISVVGLFYNPSYTEFFLSKISMSLYEAFIRGCFCGMLMYIAVKYTDTITILAVAAFLVGKCEHSIADIGYMFITHTFTLRAFEFIGMVIVGNSVGSIILHQLLRLSNKLENRK